MKRYFIQLTALTALLALATGCQKESEGIDGPVKTAMAEVNVSVDGLRIDTKGSRAVVGDMPDFSKNGFKVVGYYTVGTDYVDDANPGRNGRFDDNTTGLLPNLFNYKGEGQPTEGDGVLTLTPVEDKFKVSLSAWKLQNNSYLSYFAWASNVDAGVAENAAANPIKSSTGNTSQGAPFIKVLIGSTTSPLNVDVVAAKSANNHNDVVRSSIDLDFKHVLSKLKFTVKNAINTDIKLSGATIKFAAGKVSRGGTLTFDGDALHVGTWGSYTDNTAANYAVATSATLAPSVAATPLDEQLIIPQTLAGGDISVELTYTIPSISTTAVYTRTVPLHARTFEQNTSYTYEISLSESQITINEGMIGAWLPTDTGLPNVAGEQNASVLLLLDAYDAPYTHIDGTKYWLDRSGWNRHVKLVGGVTYNSSEKKYVFDGATTTYGEINSAFPSTTAATIDFIARTTRTAVDGVTFSQNVFKFEAADGARVFFIHFNYDGRLNYYLDAGAENGSGYTRTTDQISRYGYKKFAMYRATKDASNQIVFRNMAYRYTNQTSAAHQKVDLSKATVKQIGYNYEGEIKYLKVMNGSKLQMTDATTKAEFADLKKRHKFDGEDYASEGLLADFRVSSTTPAIDKISGWSLGGITYISGSNAYRVNNSGSGVADNPQRLWGAVGNLTIEYRVLTMETKEGWGFAIASSSWGRGINCLINKYQETGSGDNTDRVVVDLNPYNESGRAGTYTFVRDQTNRQFRFYLDGASKLTTSVSHFANNFATAGSVSMGWPGSHADSYVPRTLFQSLRIYNSALTAEQVEHNRWMEKHILGL